MVEHAGSILTVVGVSILAGLLMRVAEPKRDAAADEMAAKDVDDPVALSLLYGMHL